MNVNFRCFVAACLATFFATAAAGAASKQPIKKLKHDRVAPPVELFEAIEQGLIETTVIAKSSHEARLFVTNKSGSPVSIQVPPAVVAVQVLKQIFPQRGAPAGNGQPGGNNAGQAQPISGGMQSGGNQVQGMNNGFNANGVGNGFGNVPGNGFFSVPSQQTVQVPLKTVCLAHGKPDPRPRMKYKIVRLEDYSNDPVLHETLKLFVSGATQTETAQAAVWHLTDKMSWSDLKAKQIERIGLDPVPYFNETQVDAAEKLVDEAREQVRQKVKHSPRQSETASR